MPFRDLPDHILIKKCCDGNDRAFNVLFKRYFNKLYQFSLRYVKDTVVAEELVMDLLLQIWEKRYNIKTDGEIGPYIFKAMKNTLFNHLRKKTNAYIELADVPENLLQATASVEDLEFKELTLVHRQALENLSPQRRRVFELSRNENMPHKEIATHLNISVNTVENHISASLQFIRKRFKVYSDVVIVLIICLCLS
jgi:RNA polymerase sigma-70 factor (family 1)